MTTTFKITDTVALQDDAPIIFSGPCAVESYDVVKQTAQTLKQITHDLALPFVFKASYDKANRTSHTSFRSIGFDKALDILQAVKDEVGVPILMDVHEPNQIERVADVADVLQIPAFLCRQTDLIQEAGRSGLPVKIKRGQFMAPEDMQYAVDKVKAVDNDRVLLTERGVTFGYHNLVVDMRALPIMRQYAPVIFDTTHSIQMPGGKQGSSGGQREFAPFLARGAAAVGVDGFFIETHPQPSTALSDGPNMIPLANMPDFLQSLLTVWRASKPFIEPLV